MQLNSGKKLELLTPLSETQQVIAVETAQPNIKSLQQWDLAQRLVKSAWNGLLVKLRMPEENNSFKSQKLINWLQMQRSMVFAKAKMFVQCCLCLHQIKVGLGQTSLHSIDDQFNAFHMLHWLSLLSLCTPKFVHWAIMSGDRMVHKEAKMNSTSSGVRVLFAKKQSKLSFWQNPCVSLCAILCQLTVWCCIEHISNHQFVQNERKEVWHPKWVVILSTPMIDCEMDWWGRGKKLTQNGTCVLLNGCHGVCAQTNLTQKSFVLLDVHLLAFPLPKWWNWSKHAFHWQMNWMIQALTHSFALEKQHGPIDGHLQGASDPKAAVS